MALNPYWLVLESSKTVLYRTGAIWGFRKSTYEKENTIH